MMLIRLLAGPAVPLACIFFQRRCMRLSWRFICAEVAAGVCIAMFILCTLN